MRLLPDGRPMEIIVENSGESTEQTDVLELIGVAGDHLTAEPRGPVTARDRLPVHDRQVLDAVPVAAGAPTESIAAVAGLSVLGVHKSLGRLQRSGLVDRDPRGWRLADAARAEALDVPR